MAQVHTLVAQVYFLAICITSGKQIPKYLCTYTHSLNICSDVYNHIATSLIRYYTWKVFHMIDGAHLGQVVWCAVRFIVW